MQSRIIKGNVCQIVCFKHRVRTNKDSFNENEWELNDKELDEKVKDLNEEEKEVERLANAERANSCIALVMELAYDGGYLRH